jgi:transcriptional repressor NrdR
MVCVYCGHETRVANSRLQKRNNQIWRRRVCVTCKAVFTTHEATDLSRSLLVDSRGSTGPFLPDMLYTEVLLALQDRKDCYMAAREVTNTVIKKLLALPSNPLFIPSDISREAGAVIGRLDRQAHLRYVSEHPSLQV